MTREEEIKKQAEKKALEPSRLMHPYAKQYKVMSAYEIGFIEGAVWADAHPHWISVEDELPSFIDIVLYCDEDGNYYTGTDNIGKDVKITHWMHIPDCPPLQDFNNKLRVVLDGENEEGGNQ